MYTKAIAHFEKVDPILFAVTKNIEPFTLSTSQALFIELCDHIISQQLSIKASASIFERFSNLFPSKNITPLILMTIPDDAIRTAGLSYTKVGYLKDLSQKIIEKTIQLDLLKKLPDQAVIETLIKVKGIGKWTAEMFLMSTLGREDVFSYGDLGIRKAIQRLYKLEMNPTIAQAEQIASKWSPYRTYACKILWKSLNT